MVSSVAGKALRIAPRTSFKMSWMALGWEAMYWSTDLISRFIFCLSSDPDFSGPLKSGRTEDSFLLPSVACRSDTSLWGRDSPNFPLFRHLQFEAHQIAHPACRALIFRRNNLERAEMRIQRLAVHFVGNNDFSRMEAGIDFGQREYRTIAVGAGRNHISRKSFAA